MTQWTALKRMAGCHVRLESIETFMFIRPTDDRRYRLERCRVDMTTPPITIGEFATVQQCRAWDLACEERVTARDIMADLDYLYSKLLDCRTPTI